MGMSAGRSVRGRRGGTFIIEPRAASSRPGSRAGVVRRRAGAGPSGILRLVLGVAGLPPRLLALAALATLALLGKGQPLQLARLHSRQPDGALQVFLPLPGRIGVAGLLGLFGEQAVGLSGAFDLGLPLLAREAFEPH